MIATISSHTQPKFRSDVLSLFAENEKQPEIHYYIKQDLREAR